MADNFEAVGIYNVVSDQWLRDNSNLYVGLLVPSIESALRIHGICDQVECFSKVRMIGRLVAKIRNKDMIDKLQDRNKQKCRN